MKPSKILAAIIAALTLAGATARAEPAIPKDYPLKKCPVSGEELGSGGMVPFKVMHEGTEIWLCCKGCKKNFDKDPAKHAKTVKDAVAKK